jgi:alpha-amylase/alpha-mannosidase (GH57 family)
LASAKIEGAYAAIHGHFYQPPRENPWLGAIEGEESAHPFHDWNERIAFECYRPNGYARIVDEKGKILDIANNYASISFNFGPTLLPWLEKKSPFVYQKIVEADRESLRRFGHGNAMAQPYNHIILPLANERDKETEVLWGIADFEKRFQRKPEGMWLPEAAVNVATLRILIKQGIRYIILSPFQALRVRPFESKKWVDVSHGRVDITQPYRCFIKEASGKKGSNQFIDIFFYEGGISREVSFGDLLRDGNVLSDRFAQIYQSSKKRPQLIHIATDGETYGHHKKFGEMALAYALNQGFDSKGLEIINYGAFLKRFPPVEEVEIDEGPKGEGTSWSCAHGVGRWKEDCGCSTGGRPGWNQKWRKPLREALDLLRDDLAILFEKEGEKIFEDVWEARNGYVHLLYDRSPGGIKKFFDRYGQGDLGWGKKIHGLRLLEMEKHALQMYTSCGWFFADLSGLETLIVFQHAARAIQLAEELTGRKMEGKFLIPLTEAKSNLPEMGNGKQVYERLVKPRGVTLEKVVNHFAISSLLDAGEKEKKIYFFRIDRKNYERLEKDHHLLVLGQVKVTPDAIPDPKEFLFGLIPSEREVFRTWVTEAKDLFPFETLKEKGMDKLGMGEEEMARVLTSLLGDRVFTIRDTFKQEKQAIFQNLIKAEYDEHCQAYAELFDHTKPVIEALAREGFEIPYEIRVAAEVTLSERLRTEIEALKRDFEETLQQGTIEQIIGEAKEYGFQLRRDKPLLLLNGILREKMGLLREAMGKGLVEQEGKIEEMIILLDQVEKWGFELSKEEVQDRMWEILFEYVWGLEKSWWENAPEKPFSPNLLVLAEKLGFNMDRFLKMVTF